MVEKEIKIPDEGYLTRRSVSVKETPAEIRYPHTRESFELVEAMNCKTTVEKKSSAKEAEIYEQFIEDEEAKHRRREYRRNLKVVMRKQSK